MLVRCVYCCFSSERSGLLELGLDLINRNDTGRGGRDTLYDIDAYAAASDHHGPVSRPKRSIQLMKRVHMQPEYTLIGGMLRFEIMTRTVSERLHAPVNLPQDKFVQFTAATGAAVLAQRRLRTLQSKNYTGTFLG